MSHIRALRDSARRTRGRLVDYVPRGREGAGPAAGERRADLERAAKRAAARLARAEARRRRGRQA